MTSVILVFVAHGDDQIIGMGGTISKYVKEGKKVIVVIFSYGELSRPLEKVSVVVDKRLKEAEEVDEFLTVEQTLFLGVPDLKVEANEEIIGKIRKIIEDYKPDKIFTHSYYDIHRDHRAVNKAVLNAVDKKGNIDVFTFGISNPLRYGKSDLPKLYVDISNTFKDKINALKLYKSQKLYVYTLLPIVYAKAIVEGIENRCKYAEVFYKVR